MNDTNNIHEHPFYTFDELIEKLEKKDLIIIDKPNLIYYFKSFNYQRVINEYNKPFLINRIDRKYLPNANSQMIIDFFNFDRFLSVLITNDLHSIEMKLSSSIMIELMKRIKLFNSDHTTFACLSVNEVNSFFKYEIEENKENKKITQLFKELQDNFDKLRKGKEYLNKNWLRWQEVPLYLLFLVWSFGAIVDLFCNLNHEIQKEILDSYFPEVKGIDIRTFEALLYYFCDFRNKISHNEPIYNLQFDLWKISYKIKKFNSSSNNKIIEILKTDFAKLFPDNSLSGKDFRMMNMVKIIMKITNDVCLEETLIEKINWLKQSINNGMHLNQNDDQRYMPCKRAWKNICIALGYKDKNF